jgi:hypothetical protein
MADMPPPVVRHSSRDETLQQKFIRTNGIGPDNNAFLF